MKIVLLLNIVLVLSFYGCDNFTEKEIGRLSFNQTSSYELHMKKITLDLKKGDEIFFWTETDIEFENNLKLKYKLEIWKEGEKKSHLELNALKTNPTMKEIKTNFGSKTSWSYKGKMGSITIYKNGEYTFYVALYQSNNTTLKINKADLILKK